MIDQRKLRVYKKHLKNRYERLLERSYSYRFVDETISDTAAFKAMKIGKKLNQMNYLN